MATLPSGLEEIIADDEDLARYLTSSSQFNAIMVKPAAFLPNPKDRETSVFRHGSEPLDRLWAIGVEHAAGGCNLHGAAICKARHVRAAQLEVIGRGTSPAARRYKGLAFSRSRSRVAESEAKGTGRHNFQQGRVGTPISIAQTLKNGIPHCRHLYREPRTADW